MMRVLAGLVALYVVLQGAASALGSMRGEWGLLVALLVVSAAALIQRLLHTESWKELGLGAPAGRGIWGRAIASVHLGIRDPHVSEREAFALPMAGLVLTERLLQFDAEPGADAPALTARERDALALVAEGKTDWEISVILGVSESTIRFHVDNARRKLGAVNRAQAVAKMAALNLL